MDRDPSINNVLTVTGLDGLIAVLERVDSLLSGGENSYQDYKSELIKRLEKHARANWTTALPPITNPATLRARKNRTGYYKKNPPASDATLTSRGLWSGGLRDKTIEKVIKNISIVGIDGAEEKKMDPKTEGALAATVDMSGGRLRGSGGTGKKFSDLLEDTLFAEDKLDQIADEAAEAWLDGIARKIRV